MADFEGKYSPFGGGGGAGGTVTSVALTMPSIFIVSGSPVTSDGTLAVTLQTESANTVFAGPTTGAAATPTFRALVAADIPSLSGVYLPLAGGTMAGNIAMGTNNVTGAGTISSAIFSSTTANPASAGLLRAANAELIEWRDSTNAANATLVFNSSNQFVFNYTANRMVIDGTGPAVINGTIDTGRLLKVGNGGTTATSGILSTDQIGISSELCSSSAATGGTYGFYSIPRTAATSYTTAARYGFYADIATKGSGSTITRDINFFGATSSQGTNSAILADNIAFTGGNYFLNSSSGNPSKLVGRLDLSPSDGRALNVTGNALTTDGEYIYLSATIASAAAAKRGMRLDLNISGSAAGPVYGAELSLGSGYTGSGGATVAQLSNRNASTGADLASNFGNYGSSVFMDGTTTGAVIGFKTNVSNGDLTIGVAGITSTAKNSAKYFGVVGASLNTNSGANGVAGYFVSKVLSSFSSASAFTATAATLVVDNAAAAIDIANFQDNGTAVVRIRDGGELSCETLGKGISVKEGSNARMGVATLSGGTVTVSTSAVTASSRIFLTNQSLGTILVPAALAVTAKTAATSFVISSSDVTDTSIVAWIIFEPS